MGKENQEELERLKALEELKVKVDDKVNGDKNLGTESFMMIDYETRLAVLGYYGKVIGVLANDYYNNQLIYSDPAIFAESDNFKLMSGMTWFHESCFELQIMGLKRDPIEASRYEIIKGQINEDSVDAIKAAYEYNPEQEATPKNDNPTE